MVGAQLSQQVDQIRDRLGQVGDRLLSPQNGLALGSTLLTLAAVNAQPALAMDGLGTAGEFGTTPTNPLAGEATSVEQCEADALSSPFSLTGRYVGGYVLDNNNYEIQASDETLARGCNGKFVVRLFQQKQEQGIGLHPKLEWIPNGFRPDRTVIKGGHEEVVMRAARLCWSLSSGGGGDYDKQHRIKARPAITKTYTPVGGQSVSRTFTGAAAQVCQ